MCVCVHIHVYIMCVCCRLYTHDYMLVHVLLVTALDTSCVVTYIDRTLISEGLFSVLFDNV